MAWPCMNDSQRQTFAFLSLFLGEVVLTLLWIGLYGYDAHYANEHGIEKASTLVIKGQDLIGKLMMFHAGTMGFIAIGSIVSARIGDWFEIKRGLVPDASSSSDVSTNRSGEK